MKNGFIKVAAATPAIKIADVTSNTAELVRLAKDAHARGVRVLVYPELALTGATCGDLFSSTPLLLGAKEALKRFLEETRELELLSVVGLPWEENAAVYNCAAVCFKGKLLGLAAKKALRADEQRYFAPAPRRLSIRFDDASGELGTDLRFTPSPLPSLRIAVAIGADGGQAIEDAELICNPVYEPETVGADARRLATWQARSADAATACVVSYSGMGESTTDSVCGGQRLIAENGALLASAAPFSGGDLLISEIDAELLAHARRTRRRTSCEAVERLSVPFTATETELTRPIDAHPFIPADPAARARHCEQILTLQAAGLQARIERAYAKKIVVGISGGLDSTLALLVMVRAMDALKRPRTDVIAVTMPCFGTTVRTKSNATVLCEELGVDFRCVDIFDAVNQHFKDIGHDPAVRDVTYENAQARERTQVLMDIANDCGGMVIGTGDLSELALGWATYNGDHMSMYGVNANLPKTLIRHVVAHSANAYRENGNEKITAALLDILDTPVSPELLPAETDGSIAQKTEDLVGPYELHDFYLYYMLRYGFSPAKLYRLAKHALGDSYDEETLKKWLKTFLRRFFTQQFKRSCLPDGPAVFEIGLSPRTSWHMPSDASSALWLAEAETI